MKNTEGGRGSAPNRQMLRRTLFLMAVCGVACFAVLIARLYRLQIVDHELYERLSLRQQLRTASSSAGRGTIYDRNMHPLAMSASVDTVYLSPAEIEAEGEDRELIAKGLADILDLDYNEILEKASRTGSWYVTVARKLDRETADAVRRFKLENELHGVRLEADTKRYYPNGSLACHVIGFVGTDNTGLEGIEARYDSYLAGTDGKTVRATNAYGTELLFTQYEEFDPGENGCSVVTTIDAAIQYYVEKHLRQAVRDYDAQNGAGAIVMDVNTGAILAMASVGDYDLNSFLDVSDEAQAIIDAAETEDERARLLAEAQRKQWRNKALSDTYEPGSTFKIITLAMALEENAVSMDDSFYCGGSTNVTGRTSPIRCWKAGGHGSQTLTQAVQHSCNVAFVNIGQRVGAETFYKYCEAFGFLELSDDPDASLTAMTGIDLAGESGSIWWSKNTFCSEKNLSQLAAASFGQTFTITPLQLITAVSACVNGGRLMQPYVVDSMLGADGSVVCKREPRLVRQVISEKTSAEVREILEKVVGDPVDGTGRNAALAGYRIGGKTGTSEKVSLEAQTGQKEYIVSFVGVAPADKPRIAVLAFIDTPSDKSGIYISGGQMAAPTVGAMLSDILPYLGISPVYDGAQTDARVPDFAGMSLAEADKAAKEAGFGFRTVGDGNTVTAQLPRAGSLVCAGSELILYLGAEPSPDTETVPPLCGLSYTQATRLAGALGLFLHTGSRILNADTQLVGAQSIPTGTDAAHGTVIEVSLISADGDILGRY